MNKLIRAGNVEFKGPRSKPAARATLTTSRWIMYVCMLQRKCVFLYLRSRGRLYSSQTHTFAWRGDNASPQVSALCLGILGARAPFFWFWLPDKWEHIRAIIMLSVIAQRLRRTPCCWYLRCCCYLCLSCGTSFLCCGHGCGCRAQAWDGWLLHFLEDYLQIEKTFFPSVVSSMDFFQVKPQFTFN